jgi:hypothetical protein
MLPVVPWTGAPRRNRQRICHGHGVDRDAGPVASGSERSAADSKTTAIGAESAAAKSDPSTSGTHPTSETPQTAPHHSNVAQRFTFNPQTRQLLYQFVDTSTGKVIQQVPGQALLRSQAYSNALHNGATPLEAEIRADFET